MIGKYINQFMADNELLVNEEFFIKNMDGNRVLIGCADRYKIEDIDGGYLLKRAVRADQYLYLGDYIEDCEQTFVNLGLLPYSDEYIYVFDKKDIPEARKQILKNKIARLQSELNYFKRRLNEENNNDEKV